MAAAEGSLSVAEAVRRYRRLGWWALRRGHVRGALRLWGRSRRFDPHYGPLWLELGELLARRGDAAGAIAALRAAIAVDGELAWAHYHLAKVLAACGEGAAAIAHYERAAAGLPDFFWVFQEWGELLGQMGQPAAAARAFERAAALDPNFSWTFHHWGVALAGGEDAAQWTAAAEKLERAIALNPEFVWSHVQLGDVRVKLGDRAAAERAYQAAAAIAPQLPGLAERTVDLYVQRAAAAVEDQVRRDRAVALPSDRDIAAAQAAAEAQPDQAEAWAHLAKLWQRRGDRGKALAYYQRAIGLRPADQDIQRQYETLLNTPVVPGFPPDLVLPPIVGENNDYSFIEQKLQDFVASGTPYSRPVSIIIPTYNRKDALGRTLAAFVNQTYPKELMEIVIADDGSSDGVEEIIRRYEDRLELIHVRQSDRGYRLSAVRNLGIRAARHDALIVLDCDVLPVPGYVEAYMRYLHVSDRAVLIGHRRFVEASNLSEADILADPAAIAALPDICSRNELWEAQENQPTLDWRLKIYEETNDLKDEIFPFRAFVGASTAYPKAAIARAGFYDEEFQAWGREDTEMGYRLYNEGYYFIPVLGAVGLHQEPPGGKNETDRVVDFNITKQLSQEKCPIPTYYRPYQPGKLYRVPKVSVYIPAYNVEKYIKEAIDSVLNQTYTDLEVCIVDDGSTDSTLRVIEENYQNNPRVRWQTQPNGGIGKASNAAVRLCRGAYIGQLDADDILKPDAVETLVNYLDRHNVGCVYGTREMIDGDGNYTGEAYNWPVFSREKLLLTMIVHHFRMFRRRDWMRTEGFAEDLVNAVDYDMFLKLSEVCTLVHVDKVMYSYRIHGKNTSVLDKDAQDRNDTIVLERALGRMGLAQEWEVYIPNPQEPRKTSFRRKDSA